MVLTALAYVQGWERTSSNPCSDRFFNKEAEFFFLLLRCVRTPTQMAHRTRTPMTMPAIAPPDKADSCSFEVLW